MIDPADGVDDGMVEITEGSGLAIRQPDTRPDGFIVKDPIAQKTDLVEPGVRAAADLEM